MKKKEIEVSEYEVGLCKILGKEIKEVRGYISNEFDDPTFKMTKIEFTDGTLLGCEGEHDYPYLVTWAREGNPTYIPEYEQKIEEAYQLTKEEED